jgi:type I restriction enzyme S subunit
MKWSDHWSESALEDMVQADSPICYGVLKPGDYDEFGVPLLRIVDLEKNRVREAGLHQISGKLDAEFARSRLNGGELLVSIQGTVGRVAIAPAWAVGANISRTIARVAIAGNKGDAQFIRQWLLSEYGARALRDSILGTTRDSLNLSALRKIKIKLPPPPEQAKIAEILSTVDRAAEQTEALIAKQRRIKTGLMQDLLTRGVDEHGNIRSEQTHKFKDSPLGRIPVEWAVTELQKTSQVIDCLHRTPTFCDDGYPMVRVTDIKPGELSLLKCIRVSETVFREFTCNHVPQTGDIVMSRVGTYGVSSFVCNELAFCIGQNTVIITGHRYSRFLFEFLQTPVVRDYFELNLAGSSQKTLSLKAIRETPTPELKPEEMKKITAVLIRQAGAIGTLYTHLSKLRYLKTALMQDLLTGSKRVTALLNNKEVTDL